jgi:hypothetical protein
MSKNQTILFMFELEIDSCEFDEKVPFAYFQDGDADDDQNYKINSEIKGQNLLEKFDKNEEYPKEWEEDHLDNKEVSNFY